MAKIATIATETIIAAIAIIMTITIIAIIAIIATIAIIPMITIIATITNWDNRNYCYYHDNCHVVGFSYCCVGISVILSCCFPVELTYIVMCVILSLFSCCYIVAL